MNRIVLSIAALGAAILIVSPASAGSDLLTNGNFSSGNTGFTTDYTLTTMTPYLFQNGVHGIYAVLPIGSVSGKSAYGDWDNVTTDPSGGNGNVFAADGTGCEYDGLAGNGQRDAEHELRVQLRRG